MIKKKLQDIHNLLLFKFNKIIFKEKNIKFDNLYDIGFGTVGSIFFTIFGKNIYEISKKLFDIGEKLKM